MIATAINQVEFCKTIETEYMLMLDEMSHWTIDYESSHPDEEEH